MASKAFPWGKVIQTFDFDFDTKHLEVIKYFPWESEDCTVKTGCPDLSRVCFSVPEMCQSFSSLDEAVLSWLVYSHLGLNQGALATGICRALNI